MCTARAELRSRHKTRVVDPESSRHPRPRVDGVDTSWTMTCHAWHAWCTVLKVKNMTEVRQSRESIPTIQLPRTTFHYPRWKLGFQ